MNKTKNMKKYFKFKKHILILLVLWIIYLIGIPLHYTPYELQPSYWEFKKMCELDFMPHSKKRTEKLLELFEINPNNLQNNLKLENNLYVARFKYDKSRIKAQLNIATDLKKNIIKINESGSIWYNWRLNLYGNEGSMELDIIWDDYLTCGNVLIRNMPECFKDNKFICQKDKK